MRGVTSMQLPSSRCASGSNTRMGRGCSSHAGSYGTASGMTKRLLAELDPASTPCGTSSRRPRGSEGVPQTRDGRARGLWWAVPVSWQRTTSRWPQHACADRNREEEQGLYTKLDETYSCMYEEQIGRES